VRKITVAVQMNTPVRDLKSQGESKAESQTGDFAAVLESSTAAESAGTEATPGAEDKSDKKSGDKKSEKSDDAKAEKDISIPLLPAGVILQKAQESSTAASASIAASVEGKPVSGDPSKHEAISTASANDASGTGAKGTEALETKASEPAAKEEAAKAVEGFKLTDQKADSMKTESMKPEQQTDAEDIPKAENTQEQGRKADEAKTKTDGLQIAAAADPGRDAKAVEQRNAQNSPAAPERPAADKNIQTASAAIIHKAETLSDGESTTLRVKLHPEGIGEMEITVSMEKGKLSGSILVDNKEVKQIFTDRIHELHQALKDSNIAVAKFDVGIGAGQDQGQGRQQGQRHFFYQNRTTSYMGEILHIDEGKAQGGAAVKGIDVLA
jgi:flagellar hook-length control protein FliK